jgi:spore coat protein U-like protein
MTVGIDTVSRIDNGGWAGDPCLRGHSSRAVGAPNLCSDAITANVSYQKLREQNPRTINLPCSTRFPGVIPMTFRHLMKFRSKSVSTESNFRSTEAASVSAAPCKKFLLAGSSMLALGLFALAQPALAATSTTTFAVTATVVATCGVTATPLAFGNYTGVVDPATSTVSVTCTNTTPYTIGLNAGAATGATVANRSMTGGAVLLGYGLFSDSGHTANFVGTSSITANGSAQSVTVYGQIPAAEFVAPGAYADTITATVTY